MATEPIMTQFGQYAERIIFVTWWKEVEIASFAKFFIVPKTTINSQGAFFKECFEAVKASGFTYEVVEATQRMVETPNG